MDDFTHRVAQLSSTDRKRLQERIQESSDVAEPIAIIGLGCRFPGAANPGAYWRLLSDGREAIVEVPENRWPLDLLYDADPDVPGKMSVRHGAFLDRVDEFDASFVGISPREASRMDPQQRLLLEVVWETLEDAGQSVERLSDSSTSVFVGICSPDYLKVPAQCENSLSFADGHVATGNALSIAANRLSYVLNLHGPSLAVDTACSSALVAVHLAVQSLRDRECDAAFAGAVNLIITPDVMMALSKARMLSIDGHCRPFDSTANGYVRGEGCGMVALKRLTDAIHAGDQVLAVIRHTAVNHGGRTSGITAPNGRMQEAVIRSALAGAGVDPVDVTYIEAHGTGTPLGDPIEMEALGRVFPRQSPNEPVCHVASVKANVGHLEIAAGMASLIKVVHLLRRKMILPQTNLNELNPHIYLDGSRLEIPRTQEKWLSDGQPRIAGISSFGFGGTNSHIVLEEATQPVQSVVSTRQADRFLFTLSAKSDSALKTMAEQFAGYLREHPKTRPSDLCATANAGRSTFNHRCSIVARTTSGFQKQLAAFAQGRSTRGVKTRQARRSSPPRIAFLFTGQGAQYAGMGNELYETEPMFRHSIDECETILNDHLDESLTRILFEDKAGPVGSGQRSSNGAQLLDQTAFTQPALFSIEWALATLWRSWGIEPTVLLGHSVGEYVAACLAGVFSLEDGLSLITRRARLMQDLPPEGLMAAVFAPESVYHKPSIRVRTNSPLPQ